jgi:hypothetical protein
VSHRPLLRPQPRSELKSKAPTDLLNRFSAHVPTPRNFGEVQVVPVNCIVLSQGKSCTVWKLKALHAGRSRVNAERWCTTLYFDQE